jgi:hypothetical protein
MIEIKISTDSALSADWERSRRVIDCPEFYFSTPTPEEEGNARRRYPYYKNSIEGGFITIPPGIKTTTGKMKFIEDNEAYWALISERGDATTNPIVQELDQERRMAIEKLMTLSPEIVEQFEAKAMKLNQPQVVNY